MYTLPIKDLKWLITRLFLPHQSQAHVCEQLSHHNACSASQYVPVRVFGPIYLGISILIHLVAQWISRSCTFKKLTWPLPYASASHVGMKNVHLSVLSVEVTFVLVFQGHTFETFSKVLSTLENLFSPHSSLAFSVEPSVNVGTQLTSLSNGDGWFVRHPPATQLPPPSPSPSGPLKTL